MKNNYQNVSKVHEANHFMNFFIYKLKSLYLHSPIFLQLLCFYSRQITLKNNVALHTKYKKFARKMQK